MKCYICGKECRGPEGVIHPAGGFGYRHLNCDPQEHVQHLPVTSSGDADAMYDVAKDGSVSLTTYGALVTARGAQAVADARKAASTKGDES